MNYIPSWWDKTSQCYRNDKWPFDMSMTERRSRAISNRTKTLQKLIALVPKGWKINWRRRYRGFMNVCPMTKTITIGMPKTRPALAMLGVAIWLADIIEKGSGAFRKRPSRASRPPFAGYLYIQMNTWSFRNQVKYWLLSHGVSISELDIRDRHLNCVKWSMVKALKSPKMWTGFSTDLDGRRRQIAQANTILTNIRRGYGWTQETIDKLGPYKGWIRLSHKVRDAEKTLHKLEAKRAVAAMSSTKSAA